MANDERNHSQTVPHAEQKHRTQQQQQQSQQLYMSPQTENLTQMYILVDKVVNQLKVNKLQKQKLLWNIDRLSTQLNKQILKQPVDCNNNKNDIVLFNRFLDQRVNLSEKDNEICELDHKGSENDTAISILRRQNSQLKKTLEAKLNLNKETFDVLRVHEDCLSEVVAMLRDDVIKYHEISITKVRNKFHEEMIPKEDEEFKTYLENAQDIQKLISISQTYRSLLRLCD